MLTSSLKMCTVLLAAAFAVTASSASTIPMTPYPTGKVAAAIPMTPYPTGKAVAAIPMTPYPTGKLV